MAALGALESIPRRLTAERRNVSYLAHCGTTAHARRGIFSPAPCFVRHGTSLPLSLSVNARPAN